MSAQNRQRLYWAGKRNQDGTYSQVAVEQPVDRGILLRDILESGVCWREKAYTLKANYANAGAVNGVDGGHFPATMAAEPVRIGTIENDAKNQAFDSQQYRVYSPDGKAVTLYGNGGGLGAKTGLYAVPVPEPVNETVDGKAQCLRATYYKDGIRNLVGNTVDRKTCVAIPVPAAGRIVGRRINEQGHRDDYNETIPHFQYFEVNEEPQKTNCLTTVQKDNMIAAPSASVPCRTRTAKWAPAKAAAYTARTGKAFPCRQGRTAAGPTAQPPACMRCLPVWRGAGAKTVRPLK